jgi:hypothetical protein
MMRHDVVTVTWHCDAISLCHVTIDNPGEKLWRNFNYLTIRIWWCPRHCVCGRDFSIKDPVAEEVVVCAYTEDLFEGRNSYQGAAVFTGTLVDNAIRGKISKGDRCREVQWLESGGSEKSHDVTFGT